MSHALVKILLIDSVTNIIAKEYKIPIHKAMDLFYSSQTINLLEDDSTGLYGESPLYIFSIFERENMVNKCSISNY